MIPLPVLLERIRFGHRGLAAAFDDEHHTTILVSARIITLGANDNLTGLAVADRVDQLGAQTGRGQMRANRFGATHGQGAIVRRGARGIREALDGDLRALVVALNDLGEAIERRNVLGTNGRVVEREIRRDGELETLFLRRVLRAELGAQIMELGAEALDVVFQRLNVTLDRRW